MRRPLRRPKVFQLSRDRSRECRRSLPQFCLEEIDPLKSFHETLRTTLKFVLHDERLNPRANRVALEEMQLMLADAQENRAPVETCAKRGHCHRGTRTQWVLGQPL